MPSSPPSRRPTLLTRIRQRLATVSVVGLGYAGLPLAIAFAEGGFEVTGVDSSSRRVAAINAGTSYLVDVPASRYPAAGGRLTACLPRDAPRGADVTVICVPTPLGAAGAPDLRHVLAATEQVASGLEPPALVVLQSTTYPGTTEEVVLPLLTERLGGRVGEAFHLGYAPERIDPGNAQYGIRNTSRLVSGVTASCRKHTSQLFEAIADDVVVVSSPRVAEAAKLYENTFRAVNVGLANELALVCDGLGISAREVISAAGTKPFAFLTHLPGPGPGGDCIPVVPQFLAWKARMHGQRTPIIDAAVEVNSSMPGHICTLVRRAIGHLGRDLDGASVLLLGMAYKPDVADHRGSPGARIFAELEECGAHVRFCDPFVPQIDVLGVARRAVPWTAEQVRAADCVVLVTGHSAFRANPLYEHAATVVDACAMVHRRDAVWRV